MVPYKNNTPPSEKIPKSRNLPRTELSDFQKEILKFIV